MDRNIILMGIIWAMYLVFLLPFYLVNEKRFGSPKAVRYKMALSGTFCLIGLFGVFLQNFSVFSILIFIGLIFALIGDYFLVFIKTDEKKFLLGILSFGVTQVLFISGMAVLEGFGYLEFVVALAVVVPVVIGRTIKKVDMGKAAWPLSGYSALVTFMAVKAVLMLFSANPPLALQGLFSAGAFLFLVSDIFLGVNRFIQSRQTFSYLVGICYFSGQLMIATALFFQK